MKAKIFTIFTMAVLMVALMGTAVLAQETTNVQTAQATQAVASDTEISDEDVALATGDDDVEDSSGIWRDKMKRTFTFNKEKKAEISMRIAKKRMHKAGELVVKHPEKAKKVAKEYEGELNEALSHLNEIALDGDKEEAIKALRRTVLIKFRLENHKAESSKIHERILENKADQMTEEQLTHLEDVFSEVEQKIEDAINNVEQTQENLKARLIVLGVSEDRIEEALDRYKDFLGEKRELRKKHLEEDRHLIEQKRAEIQDRLESEDHEDSADGISSDDGTDAEDGVDDSEPNDDGTDAEDGVDDSEPNDDGLIDLS